MKETKPFGTEGNEGITPRACMCSTTSGFKTGKSPSDNCFYCGFQCSDDYVVTGNKTKARRTVRKS